MISFRYHLVSVIAVFLALAIGVVMGTAVVQPQVVDQLEARTSRLAEDASDLRKTVTEQQIALREWQDFGEAVRARLVEGELSGRDVIVVADGGVDVSELDAIRTTLTEAGASLSGVLLITSRIALPDDASREDLSRILDVPPSMSAPALSTQAARTLAERLAEGSGDGGPAEDDQDVLRGLASADFVTVQPEDAGEVAEIGGSEDALVVVGGPADETDTERPPFMVSLVESLVGSGEQVVAAEDSELPQGIVSLLRDRELDGEVVTVDNVETPPGQVGLVLGMRQLLLSGRGGDYGVKDGATDQIPPA